MEELEYKISDIVSLIQVLDIKHHDIENEFNISTKSKIVLLFCDILESSNPAGIRLHYIGCMGK